MARLLPLAILFTALRALAHGDHSFDLSDRADNGLSYAERHMHTEHHIDSFDLESFFKLHDLDMNGYWDELEIQAVYGLHHHSVKDKMGKGGQVDERAKNIVGKVLEALDKNQDGRISLEEFLAGGTEGLPSFEGYKDLGHHYDEESEYFLHHEELYHSTPETQTDESYTHPEDILHFQHHAEIEDEEDARERRFEGLPPTADLTKDHTAVDPLDHHEHAPGEGPLEDASSSSSSSSPSSGDLQNADEDGTGDLKPGDEVVDPLLSARVPKRVDPGAAPQRITKSGHLEELGGLKEAALEEPGYGGGRPRTAGERLRAGVPYKYKMRKGFRYDEF
ncbi:hypothetical protein I314_06076 [Cryptococcus bacillisporus CA1873]|uniref:EF-hand domain-containing protein n=1 Tax=Cryptococcus bacillisporus CA1873 TaxID=1296111 RepID=A0ABR5B3F8_CRYGA|nr:hypothetical protein I314_06076 [Cryptococcus bacillisporus CA1873]|eukprot:KIR58111.1 hypothetical protein I314_06076 [Cryptococcus gattii CA1873]